MKTITAVFDTRAEATQAIQKLEAAGFTQNELTLLVNEETRGEHFAIDAHTKVGEGASTGATIGGVTGALFLALGSAGTLVVPGLNLVVAGALVGALAGLGAGAAAGGLVGALVGLGIPENEAKLYENNIQKGSILMAVHASDSARADKVKDILKAAHAHNIALAA
ncbi:MAG: general stress protein [Alphaproteobacteria bacterium]